MAFVTLQIQSAFGYVVVVVCLSWVLLNWLSLQVVMARKRYNVKVTNQTQMSLAPLPLPLPLALASGSAVSVAVGILAVSGYSSSARTK